MMKLGRFPRAAIGVVASLLSVMAAAQSGSQGGLNIPENIQFVGKQDPAVRKATAIVNGEVITESDIDHRLALLLGPNRTQVPAEEIPRARAQVLRGLIDEFAGGETLQLAAARWKASILRPIQRRLREMRLNERFPGERSADIVVRLAGHRMAESRRRGRELYWEEAMASFAAVPRAGAPAA